MLPGMKAAILEALGRPLVVKDIPAPMAGTGEVLVDVVAAKVLAYAGDVFRGQRRYLFETPTIPGPGGVGRIAALGRDATTLKVGDWVLCDPTVRARDGGTIMLQGLTAGDEPGRRLMAWLPDGAWAERVRIPTENAIPLGAITPEEAPAWATLGNYLVPFGGFDAVSLRPGEVVLVSGATGAFGSAAVAVALAMGASCVLATGRNAPSLAALGKRFGARVRTVRMVTEEDADRESILAAAPGPIDVVLDILPPAATPAQARAAVRAVRPGGRVVLMGGIREDLALPYAWLMRYNITVRGQWMYERASIPRLVALVRSGQLALAEEITTFPLDRVNEAVAHAAAHAPAATVLVI